ncbi:ABC1 kinase family protein [Mycobacterium sp.]|uniref:ABC1 kinase family protein n=1 Tax=Mycobacterium sp. TaxID=1785 RepID=UPI003F987AEF
MAGSRAQAITRVLLQLAGAEVVGSVGGSVGFRAKGADESLDRQRQRAKRVRRALETLGPFYIKVGQMMSTRPDMVSPIMIEELENLHDRVAISPFSDFESVLEEDLGANWRSMFKEIDIDKPLGAASLAQVYRIKLKNGKDAVAKIQRPGIKPVVLNDMKLLRRLTRRIAKVAPDFNAVMDLEAMLNVLFDAMEPELDFSLEAKNMEDAQEALEEFEHITVPEVIFATPRVLIQSLAPGKSIDEIDRDEFTEEERKAIGTDLLALMFHGYFVERTFHADPHPGNIFVAPGEKASLIDWGMVGKLDKRLSTTVLLVFASMAALDGPSTSTAWIEMGRATPWADLQGFTADVSEFLPKVIGVDMEHLNFGVSLSTLLKFASKRGIQTPPVISIMGKSLANIDGSVRCIAPELVITDVLDDAMKDIMMALARETLTPETAALFALHSMIGVYTIPEQARSILRDLSTRGLVLQVGSFQAKRSRVEDRADRRVRRSLAGVAGAAILFEYYRRQHQR